MLSWNGPPIVSELRLTCLHELGGAFCRRVLTESGTLTLITPQRRSVRCLNERKKGIKISSCSALKLIFLQPVSSFYQLSGGSFAAAVTAQRRRRPPRQMRSLAKSLQLPETPLPPFRLPAARSGDYYLRFGNRRHHFL